MPGIEARAPERTDTSSGLPGSPKVLPVSFSTVARPVRTWSFSSAGYCFSLEY